MGRAMYALCGGFVVAALLGALAPQWLLGFAGAALNAALWVGDRLSRRAEKRRAPSAALDADSAGRYWTARVTRAREKSNRYSTAPTCSLSGPQARVEIIDSPLRATAETIAFFSHGSLRRFCAFCLVELPFFLDRGPGRCGERLGPLHCRTDRARPVDSDERCSARHQRPAGLPRHLCSDSRRVRGSAPPSRYDPVHGGPYRAGVDRMNGLDRENAVVADWLDRAAEDLRVAEMLALGCN